MRNRGSRGFAAMKEMDLSWKKINAEFMQVTTVPLETKFLAQLDKHFTKLQEVIRSKEGRVKEQTTRTLQVLDEDMQENEADELELATMAIFVTGKEDPFHPPKDIKIVIDGTQMLNEVPSVATAVAMFFRLTYALNLKYLRNLQYTLEFVQKSPDGAWWKKDVLKSS